MKKNIIGAFVILLVAVALFLMMEDITNSKNPDTQLQQVEVYDANNQPDLATTDQEED
ncbi:hypothetical protein RM697_05660 [Ichthyenterobacterium sp. W332]|uniref:Uncharacterized protein n=1 Tax=Microcosmobacter mediterraneus TaxID=3075607 RepID=A0ABU2YIY8_9FLAO|nr:hypothetical protein [Ichthyenterobacterium sp. W332]MDT0558121.1 hypothetical protein [Ichthyenterobacterium sp. W332]